MFTHNGTKAFIRHLHTDHEAEWKLVFATSSRSAQTAQHRAEALVEASGSTPHFMGRGPARPVKTRRSSHGQGERPISSPHLMGRGPARPIGIFKSAPPGLDHRSMRSPRK